MGSGRKTQIPIMNEKAPSSLNRETDNTSARNLTKSQLGGVIFGCTNNTIKECLFKQLFGLSRQHFSYVKNIEPGLPLFLFNYTDRRLHGIFEAACSGQLNIDPYGWSPSGLEKTLYPAQVQIHVRLQCEPLHEEKFRPLIVDNYYCHKHFWFELDHLQTNKLLSLMASSTAAQSASIPHRAAKLRNIFQVLPSNDAKEDCEQLEAPAVEVEPSGYSRSKLDSSYVNPYVESPEYEYEDFKRLASEVRHSFHSSQKSDCTDITSAFDRDNHPLETHIDAKIFEQNKKDLIIKKLKELAVKGKHQDLHLMKHVEDSTFVNDIQLGDGDILGMKVGLEGKNEGCLCKKLDSTDAIPYVDRANFEHPIHPWQKSDLTAAVSFFHGDNGSLETRLDAKLENTDLLREQMDSEGKTEESSHSPPHYQAIIVKLIRGMEEIKAFKTEQTLKIVDLERKLVEAEIEIQRLKDRCTALEASSVYPMERVDEKVMKPFDEPNLDPTESIFLVGGYDGESWLAALDAYFPLSDVIKSYGPMSTIRSYASVAQLNGELYVFGGGDGSSWYNTVESYNLTNNQWTRCPPLNEKKGSLAGAALNNKIFAIGGGNGVECFSDVEMLDLHVGRWIHTRSMLQKRFAVAAVELNGVLYATGGYDGNDYLNTVERFDPREHSWTRIASMNSKRGCHALVVLNERLYALGGFDGKTMVSSVEIFDPRLGSWMHGDPMNQPRGYAAAAVVKDSIYVIAGVKAGHNLIDTVEHFKEGQGWQETTSKAVGRRCFLSAITF